MRINCKGLISYSVNDEVFVQDLLVDFVNHIHYSGKVKIIDIDVNSEYPYRAEWIDDNRVTQRQWICPEEIDHVASVSYLTKGKM